jgi:acyl-CoA-dependent ceramide synthase
MHHGRYRYPPFGNPTAVDSSEVAANMTKAAKLLKYLGYSTICDVAFGVFLLTWVIGRHGLYNLVVHSVWRDSIRIIEPGCYPANSSYIPVSYENDTLWGFFKSFSRNSEAMCWTRTIQGAFLFFLVVLQIITLVWFYMIMRVAWRVVQGVGADDTRSDDEDEDDEHPSLDETLKHPLDESSPPEKIAKVVATNGSIKPAILTGHSRSHMSSQPLGGD